MNDDEIKAQWKEVTKEVEVGVGQLFHGFDLIATFKPGYRPVQISGPLTPHVAFIVEKRE